LATLENTHWQISLARLGAHIIFSFSFLAPPFTRKKRARKKEQEKEIEKITENGPEKKYSTTERQRAKAKGRWGTTGSSGKGTLTDL
jgi:hypothetical protein